MAISTNQKPTIYRNLYENTEPVAVQIQMAVTVYSKQLLPFGSAEQRQRTLLDVVKQLPLW